MCSPTSLRPGIWPICKDDRSVQHFWRNPDITLGPDHDRPEMFSVTDGAGTFIVYGSTRIEAIQNFLASSFTWVGSK